MFVFGIFWAVSYFGLVGGDNIQPAPQEEQVIEVEGVGGRVGSQFPHGLLAGKIGSISKAGQLIASQEFVNGSSTEAMHDDTISAGTSIKSVRNNTGSTIWVDLTTQGWTSGTASSSYRIYIFATTTSASEITRVYDFTAFTEALNGPNTFLIAQTYATSTTATTTNNITNFHSGEIGNPVIEVASGDFVHTFIQVGDLTCELGGAVLPGGCENATSTNRGFNPFFRFHYYRD